MKGGTKIACIGMVALVATGAHGKHHHGGLGSLDSFGSSPAGASAAIRYAEDQLGKPYCWSGTGPSCYDCSGLVMEAYQAAGVSIPRTTEDQWTDLRHVSHPRAGDLVLAPGGDGSWSAPGHVGLLIGHGKVIQAYAPGVPIEVVTLRAFSAGAGGIVGYVRPS